MYTCLPAIGNSPALRVARWVFRYAAIAGVAACAALAPARAQLIEFTTDLGTTVPTSLPASYAAAGLTVTPLIRGSGLTGTLGYDGGFGSSGFQVGSLNFEPDITLNDYLSFTVTNTTPTTQTVTLTAMNLNAGPIPGTGGPEEVDVENSMQGFSDSGYGPLIYFNGLESTYIAGPSFVLNSANPTVEFRFYGYNASSSSGGFSFGTYESALDVYGTVSAGTAASTPEPTSLAIVCLLLPGAVLAMCAPEGRCVCRLLTRDR